MNALTLQVLRALSHAEYRSGETLARAFGVSRGTIHNALSGLEGLGVLVALARTRLSSQRCDVLARR